MLTEKKRLIFLKKLFPILIISICLLMSIGYATVNDVFLNVEGEAVAMIPEGIYVTDISYQNSKEADYANSNINVVNNTLLNHKIILSPTTTNSMLKYKIEIYNGYDYAWEFKGISFDPQFYDNSDILVTVGNTIKEGDLVKSHEYISFYVSFKYVDGVTPSELNNVLNAHINYEFIPCAILDTVLNVSAFRQPLYNTKIRSITFEDEINVPYDIAESWDIGVSQTGDVIAYLSLAEESGDSEPNYDLYIQSDTQLYGNENMRDWFRDLRAVDKINNLELLNTSLVMNMSGMFVSTGHDSTEFTMDVSHFDTSNVVDMGNMFAYTGYNNPNFTLDVSKFNTSKVANMSAMFKYTGYNSEVLTLNVAGFNTKKVTNMKEMFFSAGYNNPNFTLDVSNFNTSNVTNMKDMFACTGYNSQVFTLDLGDNFDTSKVTDMFEMFVYTGYKSPVFTLDLGNKFDTSQVTNMQDMFAGTGYTSQVFTLDLGDKFDTSKVTDMDEMFVYTGYTSPVFTLDLGDNFDTSKVTNMKDMFAGTGYTSEVFTLDLGDKFDTSQVTDMFEMFVYTGYNSPVFTLELGDKFDTTNVTNMQNMFYQTGFNSTKLNTEITIKNPNVTSYATMFYDVATKEGSKITVNYTSETSDLVDQMILTKSENSNVVKGYNLDSIISFKFYDITYYAYEGMTWEQWVNSESNTGGFVISEGYTVVSHPEYAGIMKDSSSQTVLYVDRIIRDEIYTMPNNGGSDD